MKIKVRMNKTRKKRYKICKATYYTKPGIKKKLLGHMKLFNFLKNANLLSKDAVPFYNPPAIFESSNFSTPSPVLDLFD